MLQYTSFDTTVVALRCAAFSAMQHRLADQLSRKLPHSTHELIAKLQYVPQLQILINDQAKQEGLSCAEFVAALHRCLDPVPEPPSMRRTPDNSPSVRPYLLKYAPKERSADSFSAERSAGAGNSAGSSKLDARTAALLCEMFAYIDVRDTGRVQWAQFTAYMLEVSSSSIF
jgi:hypothetical protein